jgi:hypothetical protein
MPIFGEIMSIYCYGTGADPYRDEVHHGGGMVTMFKEMLLMTREIIQRCC